jgi:hypothetical protein
MRRIRDGLEGESTEKTGAHVTVTLEVSSTESLAS